MAPPVVRIIHLHPSEVELVNKPTTAKRAGDFQNVLRRIKRRLNPQTGRLELFPQDLAKAEKYAVYQGGGGYEDRFAAVVAAYKRTAAREGWE